MAKHPHFDNEKCIFLTQKVQKKIVQSKKILSEYMFAVNWLSVKKYAFEIN